MFNCYEFLYMIRSGDEYGYEELYELFQDMIRATVGGVIGKFYPLHIYKDDFVQEARIAMAVAVECYRDDQGASFATYSELLIKRRLYSLMRHLVSPSFAHMHNARSLDNQTFDRDAASDMLISIDRMAEPEYRLDYILAEDRLTKVLQEMNPVERAVYCCWQDGCSYQDAADQLELSYKVFDGRLQKVKRMVKTAIVSPC